MKTIRNKLYFYLLCSLSLLISISLSGNEVQKFDSIAHAVDMHAFAYGKKAKILVEQLKSISAAYPQNKDFALQSLYWEARVNYLQRINDTSLLSRCKIESEKHSFAENSLEKALLNHTLALCYSLNDNYTKAFSLALESLTQFQRIGNTFYTIRALNLIGTICDSKKMALNYFKEAFKLTKPGQAEYYPAFIALYSNQASNSEELASSIDSLVKFIPILKKHPETNLLALDYLNIGALYHSKGDVQKALYYYHACENYIDSTDFDNSNVSFGLYYNLGFLNFKNLDFTNALKYAYIAQRIAQQNNHLRNYSHILRLIAEIYNKTGPIDSAYRYVYNYSGVQNKLITNSNIAEVYQEYSSALLESAQKELIIAKQKVTITNKQFTIVIAVAIGLILAVILFLINVQQKKRLMAKQLEQDKQIHQLQEEKIESQVRELTSYSAMLSNKNHTLQQILELTKQLSGSEGKTHKEVQEKIAHIIQNNLDIDSEKNSFMLHFEKVHPSFFEKLKELCPDLTENNLRLCAYFRIGISPKQIAQILNISFETVKSNRYRLKKKLGLEEEDNLYDFLRNI